MSWTTIALLIICGLCCLLVYFCLRASSEAGAYDEQVYVEDRSEDEIAQGFDPKAVVARHITRRH